MSKIKLQRTMDQRQDPRTELYIEQLSKIYEHAGDVEILVPGVPTKEQLDQYLLAIKELKDEEASYHS